MDDSPRKADSALICFVFVDENCDDGVRVAGLDIAKPVFQLHGISNDGATLLPCSLAEFTCYRPPRSYRCGASVFYKPTLSL